MRREAAAKITIDARETSPRDRQALILRTFDQLSMGDALVLVDDHDPRSLFQQLRAEDDGEFSWDYLERGPQVWRVRIAKAPGSAPRLCGCADSRRAGSTF